MSNECQKHAGHTTSAGQTAGVFAGMVSCFSLKPMDLRVKHWRWWAIHAG
jgi:hypothetical protein